MKWIEWIEFEVKRSCVDVRYSLYDGISEEVKHVNIPFDSLNYWAEENGMLEWVRDTQDHEGNHVQTWGLTPFEWWLRESMDADTIGEYLEEKTGLKYEPER